MLWKHVMYNSCTHYVWNVYSNIRVPTNVLTMLKTMAFTKHTTWICTSLFPQ